MRTCTRAARWLSVWWVASAVAGCFGPSDGGPAADGGAAGAGGGGPSECDIAGDCRIVDDRCCPCRPPNLDDGLRAVPVDSNDFGETCLADCKECPDADAVPITVVPDCVEGQCVVVELREQQYAQCKDTSECVIQPLSCCGFCGRAVLDNAYSFNSASDYEPCRESIACPDIECPPTQLTIEAFCSMAGVCELQQLEDSP